MLLCSNLRGGGTKARFGSLVMSVSVVFLSCLLCWCEAGRFAGGMCANEVRARARVNDRWQLGSRARANPFLMFVSEFVR